MGIIVTLAMLFGLVVLRPTPWREEINVSAPAYLRICGGLSLAVFGVWNVGYGVQHLREFWGWAAFLSGAVMLSAAWLIGGLLQFESGQSEPAIARYRRIITLLLAAFFLLYSVTLVQLNLGFAILG